jgi:hypothetical protein
MRDLGKLSAPKITHLNQPGRYGDGRGLYLQVSPGPTKSWLLRFQLAGRSREMGLGPLHDVSLAEARVRARAARNQLLNGIDPIESRNAKMLALRAEPDHLQGMCPEIHRGS